MPISRQMEEMELGIESSSSRKGCWEISTPSQSLKAKQDVYFRLVDQNSLKPTSNFQEGAGVLAYQTKPLPVASRCLLQTQLPACVLESSRGWLKALGPCIHSRKILTPGCCGHQGSEPTDARCLSLSLCNSNFQVIFLYTK